MPLNGGGDGQVGIGAGIAGDHRAAVLQLVGKLARLLLRLGYGDMAEGGQARILLQADGDGGFAYGDGGDQALLGHHGHLGIAAGPEQNILGLGDQGGAELGGGAGLQLELGLVQAQLPRHLFGGGHRDAQG